MTSRYVYTTSRGNRHLKREFEHESYVMFQGEELALAGGTFVFHAPPAIGEADFRLFQQRDADKRDIQTLQQEGKKIKVRQKSAEKKITRKTMATATMARPMHNRLLVLQY